MLYLESTEFSPYDGYGRFANSILRKMEKRLIKVKPVLSKQVSCSNRIIKYKYQNWQDDYKLLTITPPFCVSKVPNPHYLYTMTEGTELPDGWEEQIRSCNIKKVMVPSTYCYNTFSKYLGEENVVIVPGGTEPLDFPIIEQTDWKRPYTFLTFADRGLRKGWVEVWEAFFNTFSPTDDVRLIIKHLKHYQNDFLAKLTKTKGLDKRIIFDSHDYSDITDLYKQADCLVIPSRSEGWGMPHRECAMSGIPVITTKYSALDEPDLTNWAIPLYDNKVIPIPKDTPHVKGECIIASIDEIGHQMRNCYDDPSTYKHFAQYHAAPYLRQTQTWEHTLTKLMGVINNGT